MLVQVFNLDFSTRTAINSVLCSAAGKKERSRSLHNVGLVVISIVGMTIPCIYSQSTYGTIVYGLFHSLEQNGTNYQHYTIRQGNMRCRDPIQEPTGQHHRSITSPFIRLDGFGVVLWGYNNIHQC